MRWRAAGILLLMVAYALGSVAPARAQGVFFELDLGRAGVAFWEDHAAERFAFVVAGQGMLWISDVGEPKVGNVGCAVVGNAKNVALGCGELSSFSIADDLSAVAGDGEFDAVTIEFETGKRTEGGKVSLKAAWTAIGDPAPHIGGGYDAFPDFIGMGVGAEIARDSEVKGGVTGSPLGRGPKTAAFAAALVGASITFELHGS